MLEDNDNIEDFDEAEAKKTIIHGIISRMVKYKNSNELEEKIGDYESYKSYFEYYMTKYIESLGEGFGEEDDD